MSTDIEIRIDENVTMSTSFLIRINNVPGVLFVDIVQVQAMRPNVVLERQIKLVGTLYKAIVFGDQIVVLEDDSNYSGITNDYEGFSTGTVDNLDYNPQQISLDQYTITLSIQDPNGLGTLDQDFITGQYDGRSLTLIDDQGAIPEIHWVYKDQGQLNANDFPLEFILSIVDTTTSLAPVNVTVSLQLSCSQGTYPNNFGGFDEDTSVFPLCYPCPTGADCYTDGIALPQGQEGFYEVIDENGSRSYEPCIPSEICLGGFKCATGYGSSN